MRDERAASVPCLRDPRMRARHGLGLYLQMFAVTQMVYLSGMVPALARDEIEPKANYEAKARRP
jgi:hypothetical protein